MCSFEVVVPDLFLVLLAISQLLADHLEDVLYLDYFITDHSFKLTDIYLCEIRDIFELVLTNIFCFFQFVDHGIQITLDPLHLADVSGFYEKLAFRGNF